MALCSFAKSSIELVQGQQQRALGHRSALQQGRISVRTRVAQPPTSSATPSAAAFELCKVLIKDKHFTQSQAETLLNVFPTMKDVASKDDITRLERASKDDITRLERASKDDITRLESAMNSRFDQINSRFDQINSRFGQIQLLAVLLALAVVIILGLGAGALMLLPVNPSSAFGMVVSAFVKKAI